jgi:type II secretory pathway component PulF
MTLVLLVIPAIALRLAVAALYGRHRRASGDPMQTLLSMSSGILFAMAALGFVVGLFGLWLMIIPFSIAFVIIGFMVFDRVWQSEHRALLWALSAAAQKGVPLSETARAYSDETQGDTGYRSLALAEALERGEPLSQAVRTGRLRMGAAMKLAVRLGERLGMLGPAMRQQLDDSVEIDAALQSAIARFFYLGNLTFMLMNIWTFMMLKIVPVFQKMFEEFGLPLPPVTRLVINLSNWFVHTGWFLVLPPLALSMPVFLLIGLLYYVGWLPRNIPFWWSLFRRYDGALVMRGLALAVRRGTPLPTAFRLVSDSYPLTIVAGRMRQAAERIEAGQNWCESLRRTRMIGPADVAVLSAAERVGNLDWALEEMADSALRRQTHWIQVAMQFLFPLTLLLLGAIVFLFALGMFTPLISLVQGLA